MGGISLWQLLIIVLIVVLLFGTNKLRHLGSDLGSALKGFKKAVKEDDESLPSTDSIQQPVEQQVIAEQATAEQPISTKQQIPPSPAEANNGTDSKVKSSKERRPASKTPNSPE